MDLENFMNQEDQEDALSVNLSQNDAQFNQFNDDSFDFQFALKRMPSLNSIDPFHPQIQVQQIGQNGQVRISNKSNDSILTQTTDKSIVRKCNCSKTKCLRNYCECFKLGVPCGNQCQCQGCGNRTQLFIRPTSINQQKIRCKCKKSKCTKKYCECHNFGKKCGKQCQCFDCENMQTGFEGIYQRNIKKIKIDDLQYYLL